LENFKVLEEVECCCSLWVFDRRRPEPTFHQLTHVIRSRVTTTAKVESDGMHLVEIENDKLVTACPLRYWAGIPSKMTQLDVKAESFQGCSCKEYAIPFLFQGMSALI
jgi:hypothetical protein